MPPSTLLAIAIAVAPAPITAGPATETSAEPEPEPETDVPPNGDPEVEPPPSDAPADAEPTTAPDPFDHEQVPGFPPEVDLEDEATWSDLTVEQKDQLRAIRASRAAAEAEGRPAPPVYVEPEKPPGFESAAMARTSASLGSSRRRRNSEALDWYGERDRALVRTTVGFGITWGVSLVITGPDACADAAGKARRLIVPAWIFGVVGGLSGLGTLISGGFLGGHRGSRPYISAGVNRRQASVGVGARF